MAQPESPRIASSDDDGSLSPDELDEVAGGAFETHTNESLNLTTDESDNVQTAQRASGLGSAS
jgi:hypothetical protein